MLADKGFAIAEPVGEHDRFAVLAESVRIGTGRRVDGLDEESELQRVLHGGSPCWPASPEETQKQQAPAGSPTGAWWKSCSKRQSAQSSRTTAATTTLR